MEEKGSAVLVPLVGQGLRGGVEDNAGSVGPHGRLLGGSHGELRRRDFWPCTQAAQFMLVCGEEKG